MMCAAARPEPDQRSKPMPYMPNRRRGGALANERLWQRAVHTQTACSFEREDTDTAVAVKTG
jgi:hypothetical protein